jgi:hypothetical protein
VRTLVVLMAISLVGCGAEPPTEPSIEVMATVTNGGKPVSDVVLNFQPTGLGMPKVVDVKDGAFLTTMTPGTYTYFFTPGPAKDAFEAIPEAYRAATLERQIEIKDGQLELAID